MELTLVLHVGLLFEQDFVRLEFFGSQRKTSSVIGKRPAPRVSPYLRVIAWRVLYQGCRPQKLVEACGSRSSQA